MATAKMIGLAFYPIPDNWRVPPESEKSEREINRLNSEVERLRKSEPQFNIVCVDEQGNEVDKLEIVVSRYIALKNEDKIKTIGLLKNEFPQVHNFGSREPDERKIDTGPIKILGLKDTYYPATDEDIEKYNFESYPEWINKCEDILANLHTLLQKKSPNIM